MKGRPFAAQPRQKIFLITYSMYDCTCYKYSGGIEVMLLHVLPSSITCNRRDLVTSVPRKPLGLVSSVGDLHIDLGGLPFCTFILSKRS